MSFRHAYSFMDAAIFRWTWDILWVGGMDIRKKHGRKTKLMDIKEIGWTSDMSMKEQLLARLMSGEPYRVVYDLNRSKSSFYQAYNEWSTLAKKTIRWRKTKGDRVNGSSRRATGYQRDSQSRSEDPARKSQDIPLSYTASDLVLSTILLGELINGHEQNSKTRKHHSPSQPNLNIKATQTRTISFQIDDES